MLLVFASGGIVSYSSNADFFVFLSTAILTNVITEKRCDKGETCR